MYVIAARIKTGLVPKAIYLDTGDQKSKNTVPPYYHIRIQKIWIIMTTTMIY